MTWKEIGQKNSSESDACQAGALKIGEVDTADEFGRRVQASVVACRSRFGVRPRSGVEADDQTESEPTHGTGDSTGTDDGRLGGAGNALRSIIDDGGRDDDVTPLLMNGRIATGLSRLRTLASTWPCGCCWCCCKAGGGRPDPLEVLARRMSASTCPGSSITCGLCGWSLASVKMLSCRRKSFLRPP